MSESHFRNTDEILFDNEAKTYDLIESMFPIMKELYVLASQQLAQHVQVGTPRSVLDIGAGTGQNALPLLQKNPDIHLTLVDINAAMLDQAKDALQEYKTRTTFIVADALDYVKNTGDRFSTVTSAYTIHNWPPEDRRRFFDLLPTCLLPNALFIGVDKYTAPDEYQHQTDLGWKLEMFKEFDKIGRCDLRKEWETHYLADDKIRFSEYEQTNLLHEAGFSNVTWNARRRLDALVVATSFNRNTGDVK